MQSSLYTWLGLPPDKHGQGADGGGSCRGGSCRQAVEEPDKKNKIFYFKIKSYLKLQIALKVKNLELARFTIPEDNVS